MRRPGLFWAAALVVAANAAAWMAAARNQAGEAEAALVLTERELRLPPRQADNTALTLSLVFEPPRRQPREEVREPGWFDRAKLESIGFDCRKPVTPEHAEYYRTRIPRSVFAALEYREIDSLETHLRPIDAHTDARALRERYSDRARVAIVEATAGLRYVANEHQAPFVMGAITAVVPGEIHVPREWRGLLTPLQQPEQRVRAWPPPATPPRFRATVAWGSRLEPRLVKVELIER
jgi:hypothetical protein